MTRLCRALLDVINGQRALPWPVEIARIVIIAAVMGTALMLAVKP